MSSDQSLSLGLCCTLISISKSTQEGSLQDLKRFTKTPRKERLETYTQCLIESNSTCMTLTLLRRLSNCSQKRSTEIWASFPCPNLDLDLLPWSIANQRQTSWIIDTLLTALSASSSPQNTSHWMFKLQRTFSKILDRKEQELMSLKNWLKLSLPLI